MPVRTLIWAVVWLLAPLCLAQEWSMKEISLPKGPKHPFIACTGEELARLKQAYAGKGPAHDVVAAVVARADKAIARPVEFPPRGGQHNQWYQCEPCQLGLTTVDDTHHLCPGCKKVYTGEPYDDVVFERKHYDNIRRTHQAGWAYAITGKKEYADFAAKVLLGYAQRYSQYPYHNAQNSGDDPKKNTSGGHLFEQTLNEAAELATSIGPAYDLIAAGLSEEDRQAICDGLLRPMLKNIDKHKAGKSNWQTWHNAGMIWGGALVGDDSYLRKAIADPANGFASQMKVSVTTDGMWYENSWGYHFYTLGGLVAMAEGSRRLGIDLWHHPALLKMFTLPARYTMADGSLPRFGDDVNSSARSQAGLMECAAAAYGAADLAEALPTKPVWETVMLGRKLEPAAAPASQPGREPRSEVFRGAGHAILRTQGPPGLTAAFTFGPYGGFHGHLDKLSFVFFGYGKELGVDPGRAASQAYRLPIHTNWYKATIGHNAVIVDGQSQQPAEGKLPLFATSPTHAAALASCDSAYKGVAHRRLLCLTPSYLLVVDELAADRERRFDWVYHNRGSGVQCDIAREPGLIAEGGKTGQEYVGDEYVQNVKLGSTDGQVSVEFVADELTTHLTLAGQAGSEVRVGDGVGASVADRVRLAMVTRRGPSARFVAVIEPVAKGQKPAVTAVAAEPSADGLLIRIRRGDANDVVTLSNERLLVTSGGKTVLEGAAK